MPLRELADGFVVEVVKNVAFVNVVLHNDRLGVLPQELGDCLQVLVRENFACGVMGSVDYYHFSLVVERLSQLGSVEVPLVCSSESNSVLHVSLEIFS